MAKIIISRQWTGSGQRADISGALVCGDPVRAQIGRIVCIDEDASCLCTHCSHRLAAARRDSSSRPAPVQLDSTRAGSVFCRPEARVSQLDSRVAQLRLWPIVPLRQVSGERLSVIDALTGQLTIARHNDCSRDSTTHVLVWPGATRGEFDAISAGLGVSWVLGAAPPATTKIAFVSLCGNFVAKAPLALHWGHLITPLVGASASFKSITLQTWPQFVVPGAHTNTHA